jgi:hypothetical protein
MLQQDVAEAGRAIAGRVREHGGDASVHAAASRHDGRSLEDRAHAALSTCPRFVLLDFKCVACCGPCSSPFAGPKSACTYSRLAQQQVYMLPLRAARTRQDALDTVLHMVAGGCRGWMRQRRAPLARCTARCAAATCSC